MYIVKSYFKWWIFDDCSIILEILKYIKFFFTYQNLFEGKY
jgi:hypothetical protein